MDADIDSLDDVYAKKVFPTTVAYNIAASLGALGNVIVLLVYIFRIKRQVHRYYIPVLAVVDFTGCVNNVVFFHYLDSHQYHYPSEALCRCISFLVIFNNGVSGHVILVIALQRYMMLCRPFAKQLNRGMRRASLLIVSALALFYGLPTFYASGTSNQTLNYGNKTYNTTTCSFVSHVSSKNDFQRGYFGFLLAMILLNIFITAGLYIPVLKRVYHSFARLEETSFPEEAPVNDEGEAMGGSRSSSRARMKHNMSLTVFCIIVVYIISFLPSLLTQTMALREPSITDTPIHMNLYHFFARFYAFNHIVNPFIYIGFDVKFRREITFLVTPFRRK